jgi:hypothetical protein
VCTIRRLRLRPTSGGQTEAKAFGAVAFDEHLAARTDDLASGAAPDDPRPTIPRDAYPAEFTVTSEAR